MQASSGLAAQATTCSAPARRAVGVGLHAAWPARKHFRRRTQVVLLEPLGLPRLCRHRLCTRSGATSPSSSPAGSPCPPEQQPAQASGKQQQKQQRSSSSGDGGSGSHKHQQQHQQQQWQQPLPPGIATLSTEGTGASGAPPMQPQQQQPPVSSQPPGSTPTPTVFSIKPAYVVLFALIFLGGLLFASMSLQLTSDLGFQDALTKVVRRIFRSIAFRQLVVIAVAIFLVRFALNSVLRLLARWSSSPVPWDKSRVYYVMKEVYSPLELLLFIAGCCTIADSFVPQLISVPKATVTHVVRVVLSVSFVAGASTVVYNLKSRFCKEQAWQCEMQGDITSQRRWEAYDKLGTFAIYTVSIVMGIQALGLEVRSVLAIGGIGGLAIGLAGREICENILNGFLIMTTVPFEVGDEVAFRPNSQLVEGIVMDVGWYRTLIRSFEREVFVIPNAVFSKNTVLNVTRKGKEWRFYEFLMVRVQDVQKVNAIIQDIRRIVRNDSRILNKLHRRVFLDKITHEDVKIYLSFYVEASNRDAFMAVKQDLLLAFVDCVERNGAKLATPRTVLDLDDETVTGVGGLIAATTSATFIRGSSNGDGGGMPIPMQLVEQVDVTPTNSTGTQTEAGQQSPGSSSSSGSGKDSRSNSPTGGGGSGGGQSGGRTSEQQQPQQSQPQPQLVLAAAGAGGVANNVVKLNGTASVRSGSSSGKKGGIFSGLRSMVRALFIEGRAPY